ncbi:alcohol dehydrogenase catalytic domain-containing protein [Amycolatopsis japonica]|uniref:alcohol dehydrogenase catalytic domain-containing protein n=1 Tax=Amycolatopsis japonica TaxID=208439 RepID=UPI00332C08F6
MRAAVIPGVNEKWEVRDVPTPAPGPGEVLVEVRACGICYNDILATRGAIPFPATDPAIPGHEVAGVVVEVGAGVTSRRIGDRVGVTWVQATCGRCAHCRSHRAVGGQAALNCAAPSMTGFTVPGGQAQYLVAAAETTVLIPDGLPDELAAPMLCAGYTAWSAFRAAEPHPHARVAVLGIGGVGHLALQFAKASGSETIAVTRSPDKHDLAKALGADIVVADGEELRDVGGADIVLVTGTSYAAATDCLHGLRADGRMVLAGIDPAGGLTIQPNLWPPFFAQRHKLIGATHNGLHLLSEALDLAASRVVVPQVETFPLSEISHAVDRVASGTVRFRAVITP